MKKANRIGLKQLVLSIALVAVSSGAFAQKNYLTNRFVDNWFIGIGAGMQIYEGQQDQKAGFGDRINPVFDLYLGKWITPSVGVRIQASGLENKAFGDLEGAGYYIDMASRNSDGLYEETFKFWNIHADYMLNLNNIFAGYKSDRFWQLVPYVGFGIARICDFHPHSPLPNLPSCQP